MVDYLYVFVALVLSTGASSHASGTLKGPTLKMEFLLMDSSPQVITHTHTHTHTHAHAHAHTRAPTMHTRAWGCVIDRMSLFSVLALLLLVVCFAVLVTCFAFIDNFGFGGVDWRCCRYQSDAVVGRPLLHLHQQPCRVRVSL